MRTRLLTIICGAVVVGGCAPNPSNFVIEKLFPLADECDYEDMGESTFSPNGFLDVAPGNPQFFIGVLISGGDTISQPAITYGGRVLEAENRDRPLLRQQVATYRFGKSVPITVAPYVTNFSSSFSAEGMIVGPFQLISPDLGQALFDFLPPSDSLEDSVDLFVDLEFTGILSGSGTPISTGKLSYPIKVFRSNGALCTNPLVNACRYVGQSTYQLFQPGAYTCQ